MSEYEWTRKRMKHPCPFCGNVYTFMPVKMDMNEYERTCDGYPIHTMTATVICHNCGASVYGKCHLREVAVE